MSRTRLKHTFSGDIGFLRRWPPRRAAASGFFVPLAISGFGASAPEGIGRRMGEDTCMSLTPFTDGVWVPLGVMIDLIIGESGVLVAGSLLSLSSTILLVVGDCPFSLCG